MKDMSLAEFTRATASGSPVPGGGSVAALCGSLAASLVAMVANLTEENERMKQISVRMETLRISLLDLIEKDSRSFSAVMEAYRMPKAGQEEKNKRSQAIQESLKEAARVPMETAETAYEILEYSKYVVLHGNKNAVTDGMVSAMLARTAVLASLLNVRINLTSIKDGSFTEHMKGRALEMEKACRMAEDDIISCVSLQML